MRTTEPRVVSEVLSLLGLARRAGSVTTGVAATRDALRAGRAHLVLLARDAAATQVAKVEKLLRHGEVPHRTIGSRAALGEALGEPPLTAVGLTDHGFAERILDRLGEDLEEEVAETDQEFSLCDR